MLCREPSAVAASSSGASQILLPRCVSSATHSLASSYQLHSETEGELLVDPKEPCSGWKLKLLSSRKE